MSQSLTGQTFGRPLPRGGRKIPPSQRLFGSAVIAAVALFGAVATQLGHQSHGPVADAQVGPFSHYPQ